MLARTDILIHLHVSPDTPSVTKKKQLENAQDKDIKKKSFRLVGDVLSHHNNVKLGATSLKLYGYINYLNKIKCPDIGTQQICPTKRALEKECGEHEFNVIRL